MRESKKKAENRDCMHRDITRQCIGRRAKYKKEESYYSAIWCRPVSKNDSVALKNTFVDFNQQMVCKAPVCWSKYSTT